MTDLPDRPRAGKDPAERRVTTAEFELVIRRAAELQARGHESPDADSMSEAEVLRIGREIGISPVHVRRALAEAGGAHTRPVSWGERVFGPEWVEASRAVPGEADVVRARLDEYLVRRERLAPVRRFPERTIYERARGMDLARIIEMAQDSLASTSQPMIGAGFKLRKASSVELAVRPLEEGYSYVSLAGDLGNYRTASASAGAIGGGGLGVSVAAVLAIAVNPAAAVLGAPVLASALWGTRAIHLRVIARAQTHLEAILDAVERGEPLVRTRAARR